MRLISRSASLLSLCFALLLLTGCASSGGVSGVLTTERADLTPFAEYTVIMMGAADFGLTRDDTRLIREYIDLEDPRYDRYETLSSELVGLIDSLVDYSVKVASLSDSVKTEKEIIAEYATYLEQFKDPILERTSLSVEEFDTPFVHLAVRTFVDPDDPDDVAAVNALQDGLVIEAAAASPYRHPDYDSTSLDATREALSKLGQGLSDTRRFFGTKVKMTCETGRSNPLFIDRRVTGRAGVREAEGFAIICE